MHAVTDLLVLVQESTALTQHIVLSQRLDKQMMDGGVICDHETVDPVSRLNVRTLLAEGDLINAIPY